MTTLADLLTVLVPDRALPPAAAASAVAWVRVLRARVPAFDALDPGDLVIVPAASLDVVAPAPGDITELAVTLARSSVSGLLLVPPAPLHPAFTAPDTADARDPLADLAAAADAAGVPAIRVDGMDAPALERRLIGILVDRRGELERRAATLEGDLARLAMGGQGIDALAAAIGGFLRRAVAIEGPRGDALTVHAPATVVDAAAAVAAYLAAPGSAGRGVPLPGAPGERTPAGRLVLLGDRPTTDLEAIVTERVAPLLALQLILGAQVRQARDEAGRVEVLPSGGPPWVVLLARQPAPAAGQPSREEIRRELRLRYPARRLALRGTSASVELRAIAAPDPTDPRGHLLAAEIAGFLGRTVGLSDPFDEPGGRPAQEAAARVALEAAERLRQAPPVARADRIPAYRILAALGNLPDDRAQARALLAPLLHGRQEAVTERLATLRALLDHGGAGEAAAALGIHRNTLLYRLRGIERSTHWALDDPELRLALAIAVRIVQTAQD